ncbi:MAG: helix-turn-helix domain-containing protein [Bacteroidota bacterium]
MSIHISSIPELVKAAKDQSLRLPYFFMVNVKEARAELSSFPKEVSFGFHTIGLKRKLKGYLKYGRKQYDFQEGVMVCTAPRQLISYENLIVDESEGWYIFFDKAMVQQSALQEKFEQYKFFQYRVDEALHVSSEEERHLNVLCQSLFDEYQRPVDLLSKRLLVSHLELLLNYAERYYRRQFITRHDYRSSLVDEFERVMQQRCSPGILAEQGIPSVGELSAQLSYSSNYLSDSLRNITGMGIQQHIQLHLVELAKERLLLRTSSISEVAFGLGFESPNYFSRWFRKHQGISPTEFIRMN